MKRIIRDPYEAAWVIDIPDDDAEALEEVLAFLEEGARRVQNAELLGTLHDLREEDPFPGEEYGREVFIAKVVVQLSVKVSVIRVWIVVPGLLFDPEEPAQARYSDFLIHFRSPSVQSKSGL